MKKFAKWVWDQIKGIFGETQLPISNPGADSTRSGLLAASRADSWWVLSPPGHGKTSFLHAVCMQLETLSNRSEDCMILWLGDEELSRIKSDAAEGLLPAETQRESQATELVLNLPTGRFPIRFTDRRDPSLSPDGGALPSARPRSRTLVVLFDPMVWLAVADPEVGIAGLALRLIELLRPWNALRPFRIVLVVQRADQLVDLPRSIRRHLATDPLSAVAGSSSDPAVTGDLSRLLCSENHLSTLQTNSDRLVEWLRELPGGTAFFDIAEEYAWDLRLCAVSAIGSAPDPHENRLILPWAPKRVLDPLAWTLAMEPANTWRSRAVHFGRREEWRS